jgi:hypothetical protein
MIYACTVMQLNQNNSRGCRSVRMHAYLTSRKCNRQNESTYLNISISVVLHVAQIRLPNYDCCLRNEGAQPCGIDPCPSDVRREPSSATGATQPPTTHVRYQQVPAYYRGAAVQSAAWRTLSHVFASVGARSCFACNCISCISFLPARRVPRLAFHDSKDHRGASRSHTPASRAPNLHFFSWSAPT